MEYEHRYKQWQCQDVLLGLPAFNGLGSRVERIDLHAVLAHSYATDSLTRKQALAQGLRQPPRQPSVALWSGEHTGIAPGRRLFARC